MLIQTSALALPPRAAQGNNTAVPGGLANEFIVSELLGRYSNLAKLGVVYSAYATITAPVIYSTAAGTGGPLIWNPPNSGIDAHVLAVGFSTSVVTTVAGGIGLTGNAGQAVAPTSTTAIDAQGNLLIGGGAASCFAYRVGTPANAGNRLMPFAQFHTGALTVDNTGLTWVPVDGLVICPPGAWVSPAGTATLSTLQIQIGLIWAELPN